MTTHLAAILNRHHPNGVLLDTNILLLYLVGSFDRTRVETFKRTSAYTASDYDLLVATLAPFRQVITTPHILAETNSLARLFGEPLRTQLMLEFANKIAVLDERSVNSRTASSHITFPRLGLTDAAIAELGRQSILVISEDLPLVAHLEKYGLDVINFTHLRFLSRS